MDDCRFSLHLFAGAGGGILADVLSGRIVVGAVEVEEYQRLVLMRRILDGVLPNFPIWDDVRTFRMDNPDWVEGLMDWPYRWTDIEYSCNETFRLWKDTNRDLTVFNEEPPVARLAEPHPFRPARLKSIGNGQVPLCAHIAERLNDFIMQNRL